MRDEFSADEVRAWWAFFGALDADKEAREAAAEHEKVMKAAMLAAKG